MALSKQEHAEFRNRAPADSNQWGVRHPAKTSKEPELLPYIGRLIALVESKGFRYLCRSFCHKQRISV